MDALRSTCRAMLKRFPACWGGRRGNSMQSPDSGWSLPAPTMLRARHPLNGGKNDSRSSLSASDGNPACPAHPLAYADPMPSVLVIEDDPATAREIAATLRDQGHSVEVAATGAVALAMTAERPFDAITLDRLLPDLDGLAIVAALRERNIRTPVLMLSALSDVDQRIAGLRAGGDDYLTKPFDPAEMAMRIEVLLRRSAAAQETVLRVGGLELDLIRREVTVDGQSVRLLHRVSVAGVPRPARGPDGEPADAVRAGLWLPLRSGAQPRERPRRAPPPEARGRGRALGHHHGQGRGIPSG